MNTSTTTNNTKISIPLPIPKDPQHVYTVSDLNHIKPLLSTTITYPALIVPAKLTSSLRTSLKPFLINMAKIKDVYPLETGDIINEYEEEEEEEDRHSLIRLDPKMERKIVLKNDFCEEKEEEEVEGDQENPPAAAADATAIFHHPTLQTLLNDPTYPTIRKSSHDITIGYDHFTVDQVLSQILPKKDLTEIPSSFEVVGHLAHITLREEYYPYKYIIGRVILDKNKGIKVVVNKTGTIQNEFRTFPMEILADDRQQSYKNSKKKSTRSNHNNYDDSDHAGQDGTMNLLVEVREDGCRFQLDFEKVYWNSRLQYEHKRIVQLIGGKSHASKNKIVVADACAGIGPFAIPLTSQFDHVEVFANDLNPESYKYLNINAKLNKCHGNGMLHTFNMDGRYFLRMLDEKGVKYDHVLMNLPAIAPEFLNVFRGWKGDYSHTRPTIHVHCFAAKVGGEAEAVERCGRSMGCKLDLERDQVSVHQVRNVSPKKNMYCVSFRLPEAVKDVEFVTEFREEVMTGVDHELEMDPDESPDQKPDDVHSKEQLLVGRHPEVKEPCIKKSRIQL